MQQQEIVEIVARLVRLQRYCQRQWSLIAVATSRRRCRVLRLLDDRHEFRYLTLPSRECRFDWRAKGDWRGARPTGATLTERNRSKCAVAARMRASWTENMWT